MTLDVESEVLRLLVAHQPEPHPLNLAVVAPAALTPERLLEAILFDDRVTARLVAVLHDDGGPIFTCDAQIYLCWNCANRPDLEQILATLASFVPTPTILLVEAERNFQIEPTATEAEQAAVAATWRRFQGWRRMLHAPLIADLEVLHAPQIAEQEVLT